MAGLKTPGIVFTLNTAPTSIAPLLPAEEKASIAPSLTSLKPIAILESGFMDNGFGRMFSHANHFGCMHKLEMIRAANYFRASKVKETSLSPIKY